MPAQIRSILVPGALSVCVNNAAVTLESQLARGGMTATPPLVGGIRPLRLTIESTSSYSYFRSVPDGQRNAIVAP